MYTLHKGKQHSLCENKHYPDIIRCMMTVLRYKDPYTNDHSYRVGELSAYATQLLTNDAYFSRNLQLAGHMHDIGKVGIPDSILLKDRCLSNDEWTLMKKHSQIGADILKESSKLRGIALMVEQHHERWDGTGYPNQLSQEKISLGARILALCDALDAMASTRPYRQSLSWSNIHSEIHKNFGYQFDPSFVDIIDDLITYWRNHFDDSNCPTIKT